MTDLKTVDEQIAELRRQKEALLQEQTRKIAKPKDSEIQAQQNEQARQRQSQTVEEMRKVWPNGAVLLETAFEKQQKVMEAKLAVIQVEERQLRLLSEVAEKTSGPSAMDERYLLDYREELFRAKNQEAKLRADIKSYQPIRDAFTHDHAPALEKAVKSLQTAAQLLEDIYPAERAVDLQPEPVGRGEAKAKTLSQQINKIADSIIENYAY